MSRIMLAGLLDGNQSTLNPQGPGAAQIADLWWFMWWLLGVAYIVTLGLVALALAGTRADDRKARRLVLGWGLIVPGLALTSILFSSLLAGRTLDTRPYSNGLTVHVTAKQFWWQVQYERGENVIANTANEIHLPVGAPVRIKLNAGDVIHSFWVPALSGKMDLIPGRTNEIWLRGDRPGVWRGQCAEFCGAQHAKMGFEVVVEPEAKFNEWLDWQAQRAIEPTADLTRLGKEVFLRSACVMCHAIRGTKAGASAGPDLTHLAGRRTIAAASLTNTSDHLAQWIANPAAFKPGTKMPKVGLESGELTQVVQYLETLR